MALLRPCGRIIQAFGKSSIACQIEYIRGFACLERIQGYVSVTPKIGSSNAIIEKSENLSNNTTIINDFTTYLQRKLDTLCHQLQTREIQNHDLLRIVENYDSNQTSKIDDSTCLVLLRCCGNMLPNVTQEDRQKLTERIWNLLNEKLSQPTLEHYNALLSVYAQNLQMVDPKKFLASMKVKPDITTHQLLLNVAAKCGNVQAAMYILSLMKEIGYPLSVSVFNSLIEAHTISGDVKTALLTLTTMKDLKMEPNIETHTVIARVYASINDIENIMKILNAYELNAEQILEIVKSLSISGHGKHIPEVLKFLPSDTENAYCSIIYKLTELTHAGKHDDALEIINRVAKIDDPDETNPLIGRYLKNLVGSNVSNDKILEITKVITEKKKYSMAILDVCEAALNRGKRELTMAIFEMMHEKSIVIRPHYYWPLLVKASKNEGEADIFRTVKHMLCLNVRFDHDTLYTYVFPFVNTFDPHLALRKFNDLGVSVSVLLTPLICHLLSRGNLKDPLSLCSKIDTTIDFSKVLIPLRVAYRVNRNVNECAQMFKYAPRDKCYTDQFLTLLDEGRAFKRDPSILDQFLQAFRSLGIRVSNFHSVEPENTEERAFDDKSTDHSVTWRLQKKIPHPREMSTDELECHLIELRSKGMNQRGVLRKLFMQQCRENNAPRVDAIKKEYDDNGFLWTPGMYSSLMVFYIRNDRTKEAINLYAELKKHYSDFKIDDLKIVYLSTALVKENEMDKAIAILESGRSKGGPIVGRECWKLLNTVAYSSNSHMTENILDILVNAGYCERTNVILGPLVRPHLLNNDLTKAVEIFKKFANQDRCTPLRQELVDALVKAIKTNDSKKSEFIALLDEVQAITSRLLGPDISTMNLFIGLVRNGITKEAHNFFKKHNVPDAVFAHNLTAIPNSHKIQVLTDILECDYLSTKKRTILYDMLLSVHNMTGDCQGAIELWKKMSKEFNVPPRSFTLSFVSLLGKHNVPLPEDFTKS